MKPSQSIPKHLRFTLQDFSARFPDDESCLEHIKEKRMPGGITFCEKCQQDRKHHRVTGRPAWACDHCGKMISPMAGTIFEKTSTPLRTWFYAMYLMGSTRCGISAKQIQRETGVTYKTAWRMFKQIRSLLSGEGLQLEGSTVEVDETYFGGKRRDGSKGRPPRGDRKLVPIVGIAERKGRVVAKVAADTTGATLLGVVREHVMPASTVFTDEYSSYDGISTMRTKDGKPAGYWHRRINHSERVYVAGDVHTNTIEGFWSLIKRGIGGVYHSVGRNYLQSYLDEYCFRYNRRMQGNLIFNAILERVFERAS